MLTECLLCERPVRAYRQGPALLFLHVADDPKRCAEAVVSADVRAVVLRRVRERDAERRRKRIARRVPLRKVWYHLWNR